MRGKVMDAVAQNAIAAAVPPRLVG